MVDTEHTAHLPCSIASCHHRLATLLSSTHCPKPLVLNPTNSLGITIKCGAEGYSGPVGRNFKEATVAC